MLYLLIDALLVPLFNSVLVLVLVACSSSPFWKRRGGGFVLCRDLGLRLMMNASSYSNNFFVLLTDQLLTTSGIPFGQIHKEKVCKLWRYHDITL